MFDSPVIPMSVAFVSFAAIFILRGPLGRALADRLAGRARVEERDVRELRAELDQVRQELAEMQNRLDFAERLLAKQQEHVLPRPKA